ncbi:MAG: hypothetical protein IPK16_20390 [Anaerolineales bacterium]|nr:hypothetical protein [Anaerolineales bacterium]
MAQVRSEAVARLHELASDPPAQTAHAAGLLDKRVPKDVLSAALAILAEHPLAGGVRRFCVTTPYSPRTKGARSGRIFPAHVDRRVASHH